MTRTGILVVAIVAGCGGPPPPPRAPVENDTVKADLAQCQADLRDARKEVGEAMADLRRTQAEMLEEQVALRERMDQLQRTGVAAAPQRPSRPRHDPAAVYAVPIQDDAVQGPPTALVTIVRAHEYACPYCEKSRTTMADLRAKYGPDLRIVYKSFVVHPMHATSTALAACAANLQHQFDAMDEALWTQIFPTRSFDKDRCWTDAAGCPQVEQLAANLGLDLDRFRADMQTTCAAQIQRDQAELNKVGVAATPTFFINGRFISGAQPLEAFTALVDDELAKARARVGTGKRKKRGKGATGDYYVDVILKEGLTELVPAP